MVSFFFSMVGEVINKGVISNYFKGVISNLDLEADMEGGFFFKDMGV